jgi:hypothetical protein
MLEPSVTEKMILEKNMQNEARNDMTTYDFVMFYDNKIVLPTKNPERVPKSVDLRVEKTRDQSAFYLSGQALAE